jgi:hypothetical protein
MNKRGGCNDRVLDEIRRSPMHEASPLPKYHAICRQNIMRGSDGIDPNLDLLGFRGILLTSDFYTGLQLS